MKTKNMEELSKTEMFGFYKHQAKQWLQMCLEPQVDCIVRGKRLWDYYRLVGGELSQKRFYEIIRELLENDPFKTNKVVVKRSYEGTIIVNVKARISLDEPIILPKIESF